MRFLCLHGKGTSAAIFRSQTASFRYKLDELDDTFTFNFIDGPFPSKPAPDVGLFYNPPYYSFYELPPLGSIKDIRAANKLLLDKLTRDGPYDGVMGFSQGCAVISSFLFYHQVEKPGIPPPFKVAVFICGGVPLAVLDDLCIEVSQKARDVDDRSRQQLSEQAGSINAMDLRRGNDRWTGTGDETTPGVTDGAVDPKNIFGLDTTAVPDDLKIKVPTIHVYGAKDPRRPASLQLAYLCDSSKRKIFDHGGGHDIPRTKVVSEGIAELMNWSALVAKPWGE